MRHTKIVATLGPACSQPDMLRALLNGGVDIVRLNFSHGSHESHARSYAAVRDAAEATGRTVAVMQDLSGPKIRTGPLEGGSQSPWRPDRPCASRLATNPATARSSTRRTSR